MIQMLKLMIVDDEYIVRLGLKKSLPWDQMDVQWVGEAGCVSDAIETARDVLPDIVLCDIRMPGGSGLDVIEELRKIVPWVQFIMLTAYSDRDLMRQAIQLGVCDYLFKPTDISEVRSAIERAKKRVFDDRQRREKDREYRSFISDHVDSLRETLIRQILTGSADEQKLCSDARQLQIDLRGPQYRVGILHASPDAWQSFIASANVLLEQYHASTALLDSREQLYVLLLNCAPEDSTRELCVAMNACSPWGGRISECCSSVGEIALVYKLMAEFPIADSQKNMPGNDPGMLLRREHILEAVKYHDSADEIYRLLQEFVEYGQTSSIPQTELNAEIRSIADAVRMICGLPADPSVNQQKPMKQIAALCQQLRENSSYQVVDVAGKVMYLLKKRYAEDLSREQIAAELFVSTSYMSRIVKERTGHGFMYWLNYYRIEAAKNLLANPEISIDQVASAVGYNSYRIFSNNFRKYTQKTATVWRKEQYHI